MNWTVEWITTWDEVFSESFTRQWQEWYDQASLRHVFFSPPLARAWLETYLPLRSMQPRFCVARRDGCVVFLPLISWRQNWKNAWQRLIIPLGYSDFDYAYPLVIGAVKTIDWPRLWEKILSELNGSLDSFYDKITLPGILEAYAGPPIGNTWIEQDVCPYCCLSAYAEAGSFLPSLKKSLRGDLRRQIRHLEELGPLSLKVYSSGDLGAALDVLPKFLDLHRRRWPKAWKAPRLHEHLLRYGLENESTHFSELCVDERAISWHLGFSDGQRFYYYMPVINPEYSELSPGKVHLLRLIELSITKGLSVFDHLRGAELYKSGWTDQSAKLMSMQITSPWRIGSMMRNFWADELKRKIQGWF